MAGTLTISTLSDGTNSTSSTNCIQGSAKAWVKFDGTTGGTATIKGSFNVSSVTRNSTGNYTVNYTTAMLNANYAAMCSGKYDAVASNTNVTSFSANSYTTTSIVVVSGYGGAATNLDFLFCNVAIFS
jgi:hypothetical protein